MLKNKIWIIQFLLRKKCSWYVGIILIMYLIVNTLSNKSD